MIEKAPAKRQLRRTQRKKGCDWQEMRYQREIPEWVIASSRGTYGAISGARVGSPAPAYGGEVTIMTRDRYRDCTWRKGGFSSG